MVEVEEFWTCLHGSSDVAGIIAVLAKNVCDGGGYRRFAPTKKSEDNVVAAAAWYAALQENQDRNYRELQEAIEYMNAKQNRLLATMEHKQQLMNEASDEIQRKFLKEVWALEQKILESENVLHEASEEMRKLSVERRKAEAEGGKNCKGPKALMVKLELLERRDSIAQRISETEVLRGVPEVRRKRGRQWAQRVGRHAGVRVVLVERHGR